MAEFELEICRNCKYARPIEGDNSSYHCHRNPPQFVYTESDDSEYMDLVTTFPVVSAYTQCGEFSSASEDTIKLRENVSLLEDVIVEILRENSKGKSKDWYNKKIKKYSDKIFDCMVDEVVDLVLDKLK